MPITGRYKSLTPAKARLILHEGQVRGQKLTPRQRRFFGAIASGQKLKKASFKRLAALALTAGLAFTRPASAESSLSTDVDSFFKQVVQLVQNLDPAGGAFWNLENNEFQGIVTAKLGQIPNYKLDLRLGYGVDKTVILGPSLDLVQFLKPASPVEVSLGFMAGYSWDTDKPVYGPSFQVKVKL